MSDANEKLAVDKAKAFVSGALQLSDGDAQQLLQDNSPLKETIDKHGEDIEKYFPGCSLSEKVRHASQISAKGIHWWKLNYAGSRLRVLEKAVKDNPTSATAVARFVSFKASKFWKEFKGETDPSQDTELIERVTRGPMRLGKGPQIFFGSDNPQGPHEFKGKGTFGSTLLIIKHGQDLTSTGFEQGELEDKAVTYFDVGNATTGSLALVKGLGSGPGTLEAWLTDNQQRYLASFYLPFGGGGGAENPMTGVPLALENEEESAKPYTMGVEAKHFPGFLTADEDYEVINTGMMALKMVVQSAMSVGDVGISTIAPPPDVIELVKAAGEVAELAEELGVSESVAGALKRVFGTKPDLVQVTFTATAGASSLVCTTKSIKSEVQRAYGYGVKIGDVKDRILSVAGST